MMRGATPAAVRDAIAASDPFPGTRGFAGALPDGRLVRDVLGREPLFVEGPDPERAGDWAFDPTALEDPRSVPAGTVIDRTGPSDVWSLPERLPRDRDEAIRSLGNAVDAALESVPSEGLAVAFSGGVDSALLASALDAPLVTVGFPDAPDVSAARDVAEVLGPSITVRELSLDDLEAAVPRVATAIGSTNAMDVQIAATLYFAAETAAAAGHDRVAFGQGADELFGGYEKIAALDHRVAADDVRGARREALSDLPAGLERDVLAIRAAAVTPVFPYLDDRVLEAALALPERSIVANGTRKRGFRRVAADRLPGRVADREKRAMQYGSRVSRELDRLARRAGFKRRMDRHVTRYVRDRLD
ncbi:MAG: asparagine synthase C-terminal domain-containing protein [Halanaeroarchaeum sp.]